MVHGRAYSHFGGFQIETPRLVAATEDDPQQLVYFARDFGLDRFRRFFSCSESVSSTGRDRQMDSLISSNS